MAVTKMWRVKDRLDNTIEYAVNGEKTEEKLYVSGINCMPDTALQEMKNIKKQFFKATGIQCFHGVQSFVKGEVTPEQAHEIGVKLAEELWRDKFQVVVSTHLNTDNIYTHFVVNSVSFVDGKRFCNTKKDYALMRNTSDKLCADYGLSVIRHEQQEDRYNKFAYQKLSPLKSERENLWRKHKLAKTKDMKKEIGEKIVAISKEITPIVDEIRLCDNILKRAEEIKKRELHHKLEEEKTLFAVKKKYMS